MQGPFPLNTQTIRSLVATGKIGNYNLGFVFFGVLIPTYIGRSDECLQSRLLCWASTGRFTSFTFCYQQTAMDAYHLECQHYHTRKPQHNEKHPDLPNGQKGFCTHCSRAMSDLLRTLAKK